jgi:phage tail tape-measure protein
MLGKKDALSRLPIICAVRQTQSVKTAVAEAVPTQLGID